jgi:hypothetical protein
MSNLVPINFVNSFSSNVFHLSQQKGSRFATLCRNEMQKAEKAFYDYLGPRSARKRTGRHSDTVYTDTVHGRRACFIDDYDSADLVDKADKLRMIYDPENEYAVAARNALGRSMDDVIIDAALGTAYTGKDGSTPVVLPNTQKVVAFDGTTTTGIGLNVQTLRATKKKFSQAEVDAGELYFAHSAEETDSLLSQTQVTSADYNSVKALVQGAVDSFMGFRFIHSERLPRPASNVTYTVTNGVYGAGTGTVTASKGRRCFAWEKSGLLFAKAQDIVAKIDELPGKNYSIQVFASMTIGATRMEEVKVVEVVTSEL